MKKMIFVGLMLLSTPALGMQYFIDQFCTAEKPSHFEEVTEAIRSANVKQVLKLVKADNTTQADLEKYIAIADEHFGLTPEAKLASRAIGVAKVLLGVAAVYKTWDHFNNIWGIYTRTSGLSNLTQILATIKNRCLNTHDLIIDIASIGGFVSAQGGIYAGLNAIKPKCDFNSHLLIQLYLKNLVKPKN